MSDDGWRSSGLGSKPAAPSAAESERSPRMGLGAKPSGPPVPPTESERPSRTGLGAKPSGPSPDVPPGGSRAGIGSSASAPLALASAPPAPPSAAQSAPPGAGGGLRGDSLGPLPTLSRLEVGRVATWFPGEPPDHFDFLDVPKSHRFTVTVAELQARTQQRKRFLAQWETSNDQAKQAVAAAALGVIPRLEQAVASEASFATYRLEFALSKLRAQIRESLLNDDRIDEGEYQTLLNIADFWRVDHSQVLALIRELVSDFEPPTPKAQPVRSSKAWSPLQGRFRSSPASQEELLSAMALEVPVAQELIFDKILSFYLTQQGALPLAQAADRVVRDYDRREMLGVWDFLWGAGYRNLHLVGLSPVDSPKALLAACNGRTDPLQDAIRNGQLALWADKVARLPDLAKLVKPYRNDNNKNLREAARRALWFLGDHRLQLSTGAVVSTFDELCQTMLSGEDHAKAAVAEARSGALGQWLTGIGKKALAEPLVALAKKSSDLFLRYTLVWATETFRALPLWQGSSAAFLIDHPARLGGLSPAQLASVIGLLDEGILQAWASSVLKDEALRLTWEQARNTWSGAPLSLRIAALRWSVGATGILTTSITDVLAAQERGLGPTIGNLTGRIETVEDLFCAFEARPAEVERLYADGVLEAWCMYASIPCSTLATRVSSLPPPLRTRGYLWCLGYPVFSSGISTLQELAALPDADQPALQQLIDCGALALWRDVRFPEEAYALSHPLDAEHALLAAGATPAELHVSTPQIDLGAVPESSVQRAQLVFAAAGPRGKVSATLGADSSDVRFDSEGRAWPTCTVGPLWGAAQHGAVVNFTVEIRPGATPGSLVTVTPSNGGTPIVVPITWTPRFPVTALLTTGALTGLMCGVGASVTRFILGLGIDSVLYTRPGTSLSDTSVPMVARDLGSVSTSDIMGAATLPAFFLALFLGWLVYTVMRKSDADRAPPLGCLSFLFGWPLLALVMGYTLTYFSQGIDMVGHRLRSIFDSTMPLTQSAIVGWAFVFTLLGVAMGTARVLKRQARAWTARAVVAAPFVVFALLLC